MSKIYFIECKLSSEFRRDKTYIQSAMVEFVNTLDEFSMSKQVCDQLHDEKRVILMFSVLIKSVMPRADIVRRISGGDKVGYGDDREFAKGSPLCRGDRYSIINVTERPYFSYSQQGVSQWLANHLP